MHEPGVLPLAESGFAGHLASPDVHVDEAERRFRLFFHGSDTATGGGGEQTTRVALSTDGLRFAARPETLGVPYWRVFRHGGWHYGLGMPGRLYRSKDGVSGFEAGPVVFPPGMRHSAVTVEGDTALVYYTRIGDRPERILLATMDLRPPWTDWRPSEPVTVLAPEEAWRGPGCRSSRRARASSEARPGSCATRRSFARAAAFGCSTAWRVSPASRSARFAGLRTADPPRISDPAIDRNRRIC
ncbi:MAG: hypothetical protein R3D25_10650 [Geminicoccaceae bacterium]